MLSTGSPLEAAMAVVMAEPKARPAPWPRVWVDQAALLERQQGCLCPGHRSAHRDALQAALSGFLHASGDRQGRYFWLQALQSWFLDHRQGADAHAYALAHHSS